jgi:hypothetical protein
MVKVPVFQMTIYTHHCLSSNLQFCQWKGNHTELAKQHIVAGSKRGWAQESSTGHTIHVFSSVSPPVSPSQLTT